MCDACDRRAYISCPVAPWTCLQSCNSVCKLAVMQLPCMCERRTLVMLQYIHQAGMPLASGRAQGLQLCMPAAADVHLQAEAAEMRGDNKWSVKYLFDGNCPICASMKNLLQRQDNGRGNILFVDIASNSYSPAQNMVRCLDEWMHWLQGVRRGRVHWTS